VDTVSSGSARRGRRDNGLDAAEYAAAGDVDPRVGEHLLNVLALQGIAAYLQPAIDLNPVTRSAMMPARPTDRLFVDRAHLATARAYLTQLAEPPAGTGGTPPGTAPPSGTTPAPGSDPAPPRREPPTGEQASGEQFDDAWAQIVAGYDAVVDSSAVSWPEAEDLRPDGTAATAGPDGTAAGPDGTAATAGPDGTVGDATTAGGTDTARRPRDGDADHGPDPDGQGPDGQGPDGQGPDGQDPDGQDAEPADGTAPGPARPSWEGGQPSLLTALDTFGRDLPDDPDDEEGYTPPPPPPLPRISKYAILGALAVVAGFVVFIKPALLPIDSDVSMVLGFAAILTGFAMLVWRLRPGDDEDDYDPDDGARV
jgi:hypothetical protein